MLIKYTIARCGNKLTGDGGGGGGEKGGGDVWPDGYEYAELALGR